jgi:hypothetical protein
MNQSAVSRRRAWTTGGLVLVALLSAAGCTTGGGLVTIRSEVDANYVAQRAGRQGDAPETFVMTKGRMQAEDSNQLPKVEFDTIAHILSADLVRAGFVPAVEPREADLLLVVHWGITARTEVAADTLAYDPDTLRQAQEAVNDARAKANANAGAANALELSGAVRAAEAEFRGEASHAAGLYENTDIHFGANADLLGFRDALHAGRNTSANGVVETLNEMANEERYFVIIVAYDGKAARAGQRRRVWTTRMSIGARGESFRDGLDAMSVTAATSHGQPQVGIVITPPLSRSVVAAMPAAAVQPVSPLPPLVAPTH